jgi:molecular chaperone HscB
VNHLPDHFSLFGLEPRFGLEPVALEAAYKRVQAQVHPDRFAAATAAEKRVAMQWAARANEAFATLKSPVRRAAYLCDANGVAIGAQSNTALPASFLAQQMQWREALEEAHDEGSLQLLAEQTEAAHAALLQQLGEALDTARDYEKGAAMVRQLMFIDKFRDDVQRAIDHRVPAGAAARQD